MRLGKAVGLDKCVTEYPVSAGATVIDWLVKLLNVCFVSCIVPVEGLSACVVPLYRDKGK